MTKYFPQLITYKNIYLCLSLKLSHNSQFLPNFFVLQRFTGRILRQQPNTHFLIFGKVLTQPSCF